MRAEPEEMTVRRLAQRPLGGSGNNPFLKPNRTAMEYTVLIEPQSIAKKIMQACLVLSCVLCACAECMMLKDMNGVGIGERRVVFRGGGLFCLHDVRGNFIVSKIGVRLARMDSCI